MLGPNLCSNAIFFEFKYSKRKFERNKLQGQKGIKTLLHVKEADQIDQILRRQYLYPSSPSPNGLFFSVDFNDSPMQLLWQNESETVFGP